MSFIRCSKLLSKPWSTSKISSKYYYSSFHKHLMTTNTAKTINTSQPIIKPRLINKKPISYNIPLYSTPIRSFQTSHSNKSPIIPLPAMLLGILKSGKLVSFVSLSSKTSLTLLPHTFRRDNGKLVGKLLVSIPVIGIALLIVVGLDQAPNTSRLRFVYLTEEEEHEELEKAFKEHIAMNEQYRLPSDHPTVHWLQSIVNNIAKVSGEDIRDPVQPYADQQQQQNNNDQQQQQPLYKVTVLADGNTLNASCCGKNIIVYDLLLQLFDYDENKIAVILSHEIAHSVQRHYVETHGLASFLLMLGDISRGVFWAVTESLGPYVNQFIHDFIVGFITLETGTTYNRPLEKEADLVGLKFLAKAGYDPTIAVDVWKKMALVEELTKKLIEEENERNKLNNNNGEDDTLETPTFTVTELMTAALTSWFGSTHPPNEERVKYMEENMEEAVALYKDAIRINGSPNHVFVTNDEVIDIKSSSWFWSFYNRFFGLRSSMK